MRLISLDTETTGLHFFNGHRIVEIGCVEIINGKITNEEYHTYINPLRKMDPGAKKVTGLTDDFLSDKPLFKDIADDFFAFLSPSDAVLIHNARFDMNFINNELRHSNYLFKNISLKFNIIDTLSLARQMHPGKKNNLDALCARYRVNHIDRTLHGALSDARLLAHIYIKMTSVQEEIDFSDCLNVIKNKKNLKKFTIVKANKYELDQHKSYMNHLSKRNVK